MTTAGETSGRVGSRPAGRTRAVSAAPGSEPAVSSEDLMARVARGDDSAFALLYDRLVSGVFGLVRRVLRDHAQSEEVTQEVMLELWKTATRFDPTRAGVTTWAMTLAHRRAVDRVRSEQASTNRDSKVGQRDIPVSYDEVVEEVTARLDQERVRRCLDTLTTLQRESVDLAYYSGYTYREVSELLTVPLPTVKTRMRDGLIRLRDCIGVEV